jgi:KaiC/GvpD/RAD55 family RecA-like ATPase
VEILSDVLLQHHAVQTRRWLSGLISGFRSRDFTTLAVLNPHMHAPEETHAVVDMFEGEISIYEKEKQADMIKYLRIKKMYNQRYLESELPLRKTRLMTTPLTLPCCTRTPNI